jgi:glutaredoxin 3
MARVEIYTRRLCSFCDAAKELLRRKGIVFTEIDTTGKPELRARMIERTGGRRTVPQIFIGSAHVGGCDDLFALDAAGRLDKMLAGGDLAT